MTKESENVAPRGRDSFGGLYCYDAKGGEKTVSKLQSPQNKNKTHPQTTNPQNTPPQTPKKKKPPPQTPPPTTQRNNTPKPTPHPTTTPQEHTQKHPHPHTTHQAPKKPNSGKGKKNPTSLRSLVTFLHDRWSRLRGSQSNCLWPERKTRREKGGGGGSWQKYFNAVPSPITNGKEGQGSYGEVIPNHRNGGGL